MKRPRSCKSCLIARLATCCKYLQKTLSPENNNLDLIMQKLGAQHASYPTWPLSILFLSYHTVAIIRQPDHPFVVDFSATWYRSNWHFPGGVFICLPSDGLYLLSTYTLIDSYTFLFSTNGIVSLFCRGQVLAGITFLLWILFLTTLDQNLSETYLLIKLCITSISPAILIFFG